MIKRAALNATDAFKVNASPGTSGIRIWWKIQLSVSAGA